MSITIPRSIQRLTMFSDAIAKELGTEVEWITLPGARLRDGYYLRPNRGLLAVAFRDTAEPRYRKKEPRNLIDASQVAPCEVKTDPWKPHLGKSRLERVICKVARTLKASRQFEVLSLYSPGERFVTASIPLSYALMEVVMPDTPKATPAQLRMRTTSAETEVRDIPN